jgi:NADP-dependent 3-hydroxy acid dehydrogenase YdfG
MSNGIKNKVVIIAGASSGIGEATTRRLAQDGAKLTIGARREEKLKQLAASLPDADITYHVADVTRPEDMESLANSALDKHGRIDAIFNNAGVMPTANLSEIHRDEWKMMLDINIMGVLNGIAAVLPAMKALRSREETKHGILAPTRTASDR